MVSHKATYLNVRKLGSCNCSSWKLLAVINMTRPECSVVAPGHTLAYAAVRYLSRVRNLDRLSPKMQLFKLSGPNRESSRKTHNFSDASWTRFVRLLGDKLQWEKRRLIFIHFLYFQCISCPKNIFSDLLERFIAVRWKFNVIWRQKILRNVAFYAVTSFYVVKL